MSKCERCDENNADLDCSECGSKFCKTCDSEVHLKGKWQAHSRVAIPVLIIADIADTNCGRCEEVAASFTCEECGVMCQGCEREVHLKGKWQAHVRTPLSTGNATISIEQMQQTVVEVNNGAEYTTAAPITARNVPPQRTAAPPSNSSRAAPVSTRPPAANPPPTNAAPTAKPVPPTPVRTTAAINNNSTSTRSLAVPNSASRPPGAPPASRPPPTGVSANTQPSITVSSKKVETFSAKLEVIEKQYPAQKLLNSTDKSELNIANQQLLSLFVEKSDDDLRNELKDLEGKRLVDLVANLVSVISKV